MITKRPIYNQKLKCVAMEVLSYENPNRTEDTTHLLYELIINSDAGMPLFVPYSLKPTLEKFDAPIKNPIILKLDADEVDIIYPLSELKDSLFSIALLIHKPQNLALLNFADYIGVTESLISSFNLTKVVQLVKNEKRKIMGYNIANPANFDACKAMTMDFYCGSFLFKPQEDKPTEVAANKLNLLQLIQTLSHNDCDFQAIINLIQTDPLLSFQLLKVANSVGFSGYQPINSIDQAVTRLGLANLKNWVMVLSINNISDKPKEILESGLIRAHMAEKIAKAGSQVPPQSAYSAGLLSIIDSILNQPMSDLLNQITLAEDLKNALLNKDGPLGELLALVIAYEAGRWEEINQTEINGLDLSQLYIDSLAQVANGSQAFH